MRSKTFGSLKKKLDLKLKFHTVIVLKVLKNVKFSVKNVSQLRHLFVDVEGRGILTTSNSTKEANGI